jgi:hypothetical protein
MTNTVNFYTNCRDPPPTAIFGSMKILAILACFLSIIWAGGCGRAPQNPQPIPNAHMTLSEKLPERLAYLAPTLEELSKFSAESLGGGDPKALDLVEVAIRSRVRGMSPSDARSVVQQDSELLGEWTKTPGVPTTAAFVHGGFAGFLMFANFDEIVK